MAVCPCSTSSSATTTSGNILRTVWITSFGWTKRTEKENRWFNTWTVKTQTAHFFRTCCLRCWRSIKAQTTCTVIFVWWQT
jgi:hypothetical protein